MERYVARANIDHYLSILNSSDLTAQNRDTIVRLLVSEEDRLSHDLEQLEFAENRAANGRSRVNHLKGLRDSFVDGSADRERANKLLENFEAIQQLLDRFCHRMREKINAHGI